MFLSDWLQLIFFFLLFITVTPLLGTYMANLFTDKQTFLHPLLQRLEKFCYQVGMIDETIEMNGRTYVKNLLFFNLIGFIFLFGLLLWQGSLPLNPQNFSDLPWPLAFNIASSFVTNTDWQSYSGETTLSYLSQMVGLTVQNFLSAATGMSVLLCLTRGLVRKNSNTIGNFWKDLIKTIVYLLLPLSIIMALILVGEGVIQTLSPYEEVITLENNKQIIPLGPVASQVAIKQIGTNGGGYFSANSAHPFENPTGFSNLLESLAIILIPSASVYAFGLMIGSKEHAWLLYCIMLLFWGAGVALSLYSEHLDNPSLDYYPYLEGKEVRLGITNSLLWIVTATTTANGAVNAMISSLSPIAGGVAMFNIMIGELIFGGIGLGLCSMIMFVLLTIFLSGLMVGRTPEYLGKKIEKKEMQRVIIAILMPAALVLIGAGIASVLPSALSSLGNNGPHGLSEILYAFISSAGNNGSAFAGLNANTNFYNLILGAIMLTTRSTIILASLSIASLLAAKKTTPPSAGTFSPNSLLFFILLASVIIIEGGLAFFPALSLGPFVEHLLMLDGRTF